MRSVFKRAELGEDGFTLVELVVVLVILGLLAATLVPSMSGYISGAQSTACELDQTQIKTGFSASYALKYGSNTNNDNREILEDALNNLAIQDVNISGSKDSFQISGVCPSGGIYTINVNKNHTVSVTCDQHGGTKQIESMEEVKDTDN